MDPFADITEGNARFADAFDRADLVPFPTARLAVVTCMDCRIDPLSMLGVSVGDIHVMRNAGARVTPDVIRSLIKSVNQLEVERIAVIAHTDCGAAKITLPALREKVLSVTGNDPADVDFHLIGDPLSALAGDIEILRTCPWLPVGTAIAGFVYDVTDGRLTQHHSTFVG
jgi:carbonic anhydrase